MTTQEKRKLRIRAKVSGTAARPRISVFRSNEHLYLQAIDDVNGKTIAASSDLKKDANVAGNLAKALQEKKVKKVVFDRAGYKYHGQVKKVAEELRKAGLEF